MKRSRLYWFFAALLLIGGIAAVLYAISRRDSDFVIVSKKTQGVRDGLAMLNTTVDLADFRDCQTVEEALNRLYARLKEVERGRELDKIAVEQWIHIDRRAIQVDEEAFKEVGIGNIGEQPIQLPNGPETVTIKQFLRIVFREHDARFIVRWNAIVATTAKHAEEERARYLDSVSIYDRMRDWWKEINGEIQPDLDFFPPML